MLRAQLAEFGVVIPQGIYHALAFAKDWLNGEQPNLPKVAGDVIFGICGQLQFSHSKILGYSRQMSQIAKREKRVALLRTIPGVGPITTSAIVATVGSGKQFNNGREFAAWLGLTPINKSSGGKERLGHISKMANAGLGVVHGLAGPLGGLSNTSHGSICGALLPHCLEANHANASTPAYKSRIEYVAQMISEVLDHSTTDAFTSLDQWTKDHGLLGLKSFGIDTDMQKRAAKMAAASSSMASNPAQLTTQQLEQIQRNAS